MAHVQITVLDEAVSVVVDGVDITGSLLADPFTLDLGDFPYRRPRLYGVLAVDEVRVDVPDADDHLGAAER